MKETARDTATSVGCQAIKIGWFTPFIELPCDQGSLKATEIGRVLWPVSFIGFGFHKANCTAKN